jgi:hypothetical protein
LERLRAGREGMGAKFTRGVVWWMWVRMSLGL